MVFKSDRQRKAVMAKLTAGTRSSVTPQVITVSQRKTTFSKVSGIADAFAKGLRNGKARADAKFPQGRVFIDGDAIFSFGRHFPVAIKTGVKEAEFNTDKFSETTSKQQSEIRRNLIINNFKLKNVNTQQIKQTAFKKGIDIN